MTPRNRSKDLTADLLHDLEAESAAPAAVGPSAAVPAAAPAVTKPAAFVETSLYLAPSAWRRPAVSRAAGSVLVSVGLMRLRIGRRPA